MVVDESLLNYIREVKARGYSQETVRNALINKGWPPEVVDDAILMVGISIESGEIPPQKPEPQQHAPVKTKSNKKIILIAFILALFSIIAILIYLISSNMLSVPKIEVPTINSNPETPAEPTLQNQFCKYSEPIECSEYQIAPQFMTLSFKNMLNEDIKINSVTIYVNEDKCITEREITINANGEAQFLIDTCSSDLISKFQSGFSADVAYSKGRDRKTVKLTYS